MDYVKLSRSEFFAYIKIIIALDLIPFLFHFFFASYDIALWKFNSFAPHHELLNQFSGNLPHHTILLKQISGYSSWILGWCIALATGIIIHRSEKRKGFSNYYWILIGFVFRFVGFVSYVLWGIIKELNLLRPPVQKQRNYHESD